MVQIDMHNYTAGRKHMTSTAANVTVDISWYSNHQFVQYDFLEMQSF
jgi:hypothetical protein